jgi:hypothetical protein
MDYQYGQGWSEERKQAHRIEKLLEVQIVLLGEILLALNPPPPPPPTYQPTIGVQLIRN